MSNLSVIKVFRVSSALALAMCLFFQTIISVATEAEEPQGKETEKIPILSKEQAEKLPKIKDQDDKIPLVSEGVEKDIDELQKRGTELLLGAADWFDSFFDDPRYLQEENKTRARLKFGLGYTRFDDLEFVSSLDLRIKLPGLEKKANLYIRANDDSDFDADSNPISDATGGASNDREQVSVGIQYFIKAGEKLNISTEVGLSFDYLYGGLRYRNLHKFFSEEWQARFTDRLRYYTDDGWENKIAYDIEHHFLDRYLYRTIFSAVVAEKDDGIPFSAVSQIYQVLSINRAILYDASAYFDTEPKVELTDFQVKIRYRQRFYRDWLTLEVSPQVTFPRDHDYEVNPGLIIKFEADFGYLKDREAYQSIFNF